MCSKRMSPRSTFSGRALGLSKMVCGLESVTIPSDTVPMFSNSRADSHMINCDKPFSRNAMAVAVATAPAPTCPPCHSQMPSAAVESVSDELMMKLEVCSSVASRICAYTVTINSSIDCLAYLASRAPCEKSFTVAMLEYASVMRPVIRLRASACACAVLPSLGISVFIMTANDTIHSANGTSSQLSSAASIRPEVKKYTSTYTTMSATVITTSRTASAVCMTLADTRPANSS